MNLNPRYFLPASFALTAHAFLLFGLPGKPAAAPASPDASRPSFDKTPTLMYDQPVRADSDEDGPKSSAAGNEEVSRLADIPPLRTAWDAFTVEPLPAHIGDLNRLAIPVGWSGNSISSAAPLDVNQLDHVPRARLQTMPVYPSALRRQGMEATIVVEFAVDISGNVYNASVLRASVPGFAEAALHAVARWKFEPGTKNGRRVSFRMSIPIVFKLDAGQT